MIIFISCTKKKQDHPCKARDMYMPSQWFKGAWNYAQTLNPNEVYILSAKYGVLHPDDQITPYEKSLISARDTEIRNWSIMVADQIKRRQIDRTQKTVFLCGKNYRKYIQNLFPDHIAPCKHLGIGEQIKFFKEKTK